MPDRFEYASEERFRQVLEAAPVGMIVVDEGGVIVMVNENLERTFQYARSELLGHPLAMLIPERFRPRHAGHCASFTADPRPRAMGGRELSGRRKDGSEIPIEVGLTAFAEGGARKVLGSVVDISERLRAEAARQKTVEALQSFQLMVERVEDYAIFQLDAAGRVRTWNSGARAIKGYEAEEIIGRHISVFYPPETSSRPAEELRIAAEAGRYEEEGWRVRKDGTRFWANVVITALPGSAPGTVRGFVKVTRDLTERKRTEDALAALLRERTALLQEVHHRVKNNLQMVASLLSLQSRQITDERARAVFEETRGRVRSIALLHESLYQSADLGRVDMREYVHRLVAALQQTVVGDATSPRIVQHVGDVHLPVDVAVPCGLVIHELVTNALKHAFTGRAASEDDAITLSLSESPGSYSLIVQDNGRGFPAALHPDDEKTMGITLVHDLASQLQGSVAFESEGGGRCTIVFPRPRPAAQEVLPARAP